MEEKTRMLRAATRDNRKSRLQSVKLAKDAYKIFLTRYTQDNNATKNRENYLKQKSTVKPVRQELPEKDFENINNFFESFTHKFRDKKAAYLRRVYFFIDLVRSLFISKKLIDIISRIESKEN